MKRKSLNKKLLIRKTTIAHLNNNSMSEVNGGIAPTTTLITYCDQETCGCSNETCVQTVCVHETCAPYSCDISCVSHLYPVCPC